MKAGKLLINYFFQPNQPKKNTSICLIYDHSIPKIVTMSLFFFPFMSN